MDNIQVFYVFFIFSFLCIIFLDRLLDFEVNYHCMHIDGKKLKIFRIENDLTFEVMSKAIGITAGALSKIENEKVRPNERTIYKIYKAFPEFRRLCPEAFADESKTLIKETNNEKVALLPLFPKENENNTNSTPV